MKKASKIIVLVGTVLLSGVAIALTILVLLLMAWFSGALLFISIAISYAALQIALPIIAAVFVFTKNDKLVFTGFILAIIAGCIALILQLFQFEPWVQFSAAMCATPLLIGGIIGLVAIKKQ